MSDEYMKQQLEEERIRNERLDAEYQVMTRFEKTCMVMMLLSELILIGFILGGVK